MKKRLLISISSIALSGLIILIWFMSPRAEEPPIKLGVNEIRSGAFKSNGDRIIWGIEAAVKEVNEAGGLLGRKVEIIVEDNQMKNDIAVQKVKKLLLEDQAIAILQGSSSSVGGGIAQTMPRYKKIYLDLAAEAVSITGENFNPYVFRTCLNAAMHVKGLAKYFASKGYKKVFLINQDYSWGHDVADYYEKFIKAYAPDTQIVGKEFHPIFNKDFGPYISKINASGAEYVISGNWGTDLAQLMIQGKQFGMKLLVGGTFFDDDGVMNIVRENAIGSITANMYLAGVDTPSAKAFEENFNKLSGGKWPVFVAMEAYLGTKMFFQAIKKAGSLDTEKIIEAFEGMTMEGPIGTLTMRKEDHQIQTPVVIGEVIEKTPYYDFPYPKPLMIIPAEEVSISLEESGWKGWQKKE
jgi:branched-chain amino acid transport system substrate-binding protein